MTATLAKIVTKKPSLFICGHATGIAYCDKSREEHGDYKKVAFLDYATLTLEIEGVPFYRTGQVHKGDSPMIRSIKRHANAIQAKRGEEYNHTETQTITLGYAGRRIPKDAGYCKEFLDNLAAAGAANSKTPEQVFQLWHQYATACSGEGGQSCIFSEFLSWYRKDLPNVPEGMHRIGG